MYASILIPEISDTPKPIDDAMRWGFGHEAGPFEIWDMLGVSNMKNKMEETGFDPAPWVKDMLKSDHNTFYQYDGDRKIGVYNPSIGGYEPIPQNPAHLFIKDQKQKGNVVSQNTDATLVDIGDGVCIVEFNTKMNILDQGVFEMINRALDKTESGDFEGIIIGTDDTYAFCAGANLGMILMAAKMGQWDLLEGATKTLQDVGMRMRYSPKPVVIAPAGLCLGGGAEITMHASRVVAAAELYVGQVEIGVGVIPAGGGTKELLRRIINPVMRIKDAIGLPAMQHIFELIGMAKIATSAEEARQLGFLGSSDRIVMNRDHVIAEAKKEVLHMLDTNWHPPAPELIYAGGRDMLAALRSGLAMFASGGYITEYEHKHIGQKMIYVMSGGELSSPTWVTEQYILDLEREAFLSLCGEKKTQERMYHMLENGKALRN